MATILGLHYGHHGTACIVRDGKLVAALSTERMRKGRSVGKYCHGVTDELLYYLFSWVGIDIGDVDFIGLSDWNDQFAYHDIKARYRGGEIKLLWNTIFGDECLEMEVDLRGRTIPAYHIGHHLSHAAAAFYTSPFHKAYCFTMDASGGKVSSNSLVAYGEGQELISLYCPGASVGYAYNHFTEHLGLGPGVAKAGSMMALAGYGKLIEEDLDKHIEESFIFDQTYHEWWRNVWKKLSGSSEPFGRKESDSEKAMDIAATFQYIFQRAILRCVNEIDSGEVKNLCLGGGSALNCIANSLVLQESKFDNVHLFPACTDDGCCIGTALYIAHQILGEERLKYEDSEICYMGPGQPFKEPDYAYLAQQLEKGKIIAWCSGRSEIGPRALGNRSILADPRKKSIRERINFKVKHREWFRPLAPIVMEEHAHEWFEFPTKSPFMLHTMPIKYPNLLPAVNHVDGSARIQTVTEKSNPDCYRLIDEFRSLTGVPVLLNTSLNGNGEPIVETNDHAYQFFKKGTVDILVLHGRVFEKID